MVHLTDSLEEKHYEFEKSNISVPRYKLRK